MKKSIARLTLDRETIRTLVDDELARVVGGVQDCADITRLVSGCTVSTAKSIVQSPAAEKV